MPNLPGGHGGGASDTGPAEGTGQYL
jgi:hypothetical protein